MPRKTIRQSKTKGASVGSHNTSTSQFTSEDFDEAEFRKLSVPEMIAAIKERNRDPVVDELLEALVAKIPKRLATCAEAESRARNVEMNGLKADTEMPNSQLQAEK
ncbi:hypothetical protein Y032_0016g2982 [Ancylostoma ceylanicum]|uniref:Uncharacterized protein n=1 Tax=Ancylostoma ceylanicum TaxID=53326 RepID=A0A016V733_9BILA|nr:hypothetical protein Y032_0016g2982 [Ancylostoma ceylanicum]